MVQPINYQIQVANPLEEAMKGYQMGANIASHQAQVQQNIKAQQLAQIKQADLEKLANTNYPTAKDYAGIITRHPELADQLSKSWSVLNEDRQQNSISQASQVYAALSSGKPDVAKQLLDQHAQAAKNSGDTEGAQHAETMSKLIDLDPAHARNAVGLTLASMMGPKNFAETMGKLGSEQRAQELQQAAMTKAQAEANKAAIEAKYADSNAVVDLQKKGWDIEALQNDMQVKNANVRIAALNAQLQREDNALKRQELKSKLDDAEMKREQTLRDKTTAVETGRDTIDNSLSTIDRILKAPGLPDVVGAAEGSEYYPNSLMGSITPFGSSADERANAIADIETLKSQTFLNQLQALKSASATGGSGLCALSEAEGQRLINGLQSLSRKQGLEHFKSNLQEVQRLLLKARGGLARKYGVPENIPDTPNAAPSEDEINRLLQKHGISTGPGPVQTVDINMGQ